MARKPIHIDLPSGSVRTRISGIPCEARLTHFFEQKALGKSASNDLDAEGYAEIEFAIFDLSGYPAAWLVKKMTDADEDRIKNELHAACAGLEWT